MTESRQLGSGSGPYPDCHGSGACSAQLHSPSCLSCWRTDAELDAAVVPPDDELRRRRDLADADDLFPWGRSTLTKTPLEQLLGAIYEPGPRLVDQEVLARQALNAGLPGQGKGVAVLGDTITEAGRPYVRVTDLTAVPVGARLRRDHPNHMSTTLTVVGAYGEHGNPPSDGLLCHVHAFKGDGWDTVLTPYQLADSAVWLLSTPASQEPTHAPCCAVHQAQLDCDTYRRTHVVEAGQPCCSTWAQTQPESGWVPRGCPAGFSSECPNWTATDPCRCLLASLGLIDDRPDPLDRLAICAAHGLAANAASGVGIPLGMWAGRGDYATFSDDARDKAGRRALTKLDQAIVEIIAVRDRLAKALEDPDPNPHGLAVDLDAAWTLYTERLGDHTAGSGHWEKVTFTLAEGAIDLEDDRLRTLVAKGRKAGVVIVVTRRDRDPNPNRAEIEGDADA